MSWAYWAPKSTTRTGSRVRRITDTLTHAFALGGFAAGPQGPVRCSAGYPPHRARSLIHRDYTAQFGKGLCVGRADRRDRARRRRSVPYAGSTQPPSGESEIMANPTLNEKRFEAIQKDDEAGWAAPVELAHAEATGAPPTTRVAHMTANGAFAQHVRAVPARHRRWRRRLVADRDLQHHQPGEHPGLVLDRAVRRLRAGHGLHLPAEGVAHPGSAVHADRGRVPRRDLEGVRGPVGRHRLPGRPRDDRRVLRHARALRVRRGEGHPAVPDGGASARPSGIFFLYLFGALLSLFGVDVVFWNQPSRARASSSAS